MHNSVNRYFLLMFHLKFCYDFAISPRVICKSLATRPLSMFANKYKFGASHYATFCRLLSLYICVTNNLRILTAVQFIIICHVISPVLRRE